MTRLGTVVINKVSRNQGSDEVGVTRAQLVSTSGGGREGQAEGNSGFKMAL